MAFSLCACNTLSNRRSLYSPKKGEGYWTRSLHSGEWKKRGTKSADQTVKRANTNSAPAAAPSAPSVPVVQPTEPLPETGGTAQ